MEKVFVAKDIIVLCKKCGRKFIYPYKGYGKKPTHCVNCATNLRNRDASLERYVDDVKSTKDIKKVVEGVKISNDRVERENEEYNKFWRRVIEVLNRLDTCRVDLCALAGELNQYQSGFDKIDQVYLHNLENIDVSDTAGVKKFVSDWKTSRNGRRDVKDIIFFIKPIIESIPLKNVASAYDCMETNSNSQRSYNANKIKVTIR